jgi:hypothetical protein
MIKNYLREKHQISNYQIAQIEFLFKTIFSEFSKIMIIGLLFPNQLEAYLFALCIMLFMRCSTGGLHFYERAEDGLHREIREETGLEAAIGPPVSLFDVIKYHIHLCIFTYACRWLEGEVRLSGEHEAFYWLTEDEAEESDLPSWLKRDIHRAFAAVGKGQRAE